MTDLATSAATHGPEGLERQLEQHRVPLTGLCYRMLGSPFEADDAVQETMVRAWRGLDRFEGRSALKSWLHRIATNVCLDMLNGRQRRARPMDLGSPSTAESALLAERSHETWIEPVPDHRVLPTNGDPGELAVSRESVRLAFIGALQHLPPRQRAVLILREVLSWRADEVAVLLDTTVASVNSALQRARATLAAENIDVASATEPMDDEHEALLARYVDAFERYDVDSLTSLLHEDATMSMPPYDLWLQGHRDISGWLLGEGIECRGSRMVPVSANGSTAFGQYRPSGPAGSFEPWALQIIEVSDGRITGINSFLDTSRLFPLFGLQPMPGS